MNKITRHYVLAGNRDEYLNFLKELSIDSKDYLIRSHDPSEIDGNTFQYLSSYRTLQGRSDYYLVTVGTWITHDTDDLMRIYELYDTELLRRRVDI